MLQAAITVKYWSLFTVRCEKKKYVDCISQPICIVVVPSTKLIATRVFYTFINAISEPENPLICRFNVCTLGLKRRTSISFAAASGIIYIL